MKNLCCLLFWCRKASATVLGTWFGTLKMALWGCRLHGMVKCVGLPRIERTAKGRIEVGKGCCLRSARCSNPVGVFHPVQLATIGAGRIVLGDGCGVSGSVLVAENSITLGRRVMIGAGCIVIDSDCHSLDVDSRARGERGKTAPVVLEDDVLLGINVLVLKGVRIGAGTVVGAGSVVTGDLPAGVIAAGNPARVVGVLKPEYKTETISVTYGEAEI